ncbi:glycosyltransferase family 4 protein [Nitrosomonas oligotropha]|uniref:Glycosyltransferase involved in cell wall bisynthesis n=1 Tax=Nitrosomonas oligotropha TaxID=42354 RepID=A0A1H8PJS8_9PROT|nr:glycosyltransferase family 4 protein [Nitrosomonas oligotropha]SDX40345.1 Glycosyltransferase involved in cell wall bisynthesis [Nitrosomonas oligotropha]SEO42232.1 Glycosyltransferase involved in cell wall bisynthesis [Nitrosomonas oligotropha]
MNILHITLGRVNPNSANGVNKVIEGLAKYTNIQSDNIALVYTIRKKQVERIKKYERDGFNVITFRSIWILIREILRNQSIFDAIHLHNVWSFHNDIIALILFLLHKPYIITIHAGLAPDRVKGSNYYAKRIYHALIQRWTLDRALFLHALSDEEVLQIEKYSLNRDLFRLPNGVILPTISHYSISKTNRYNDQHICIGYIGRFAKEKNVESLIRAIGILNKSIGYTIKLRLAGPLDRDAIELAELANNDLNIQGIEFIGPLYGAEKENFFLSIDCIVHPAISEGASISVLEAAAYGTPMVLSRSSAAAYFSDQDFFISINPDPTGIANGIKEIISKRDRWTLMGRASRSYVQKNLTWETIVTQLLKKMSEALAKQG